MEAIEKTVTCDLCGKKIEQSRFPHFLFGDRFFIRPRIFGRESKIDLCDNCVVTLKKIRKQEEGIKDKYVGGEL